MMSSCLLNDFKSSWLSVHFPMTDDLGQRLWPVTVRWATGSHLTLALKGPVEAALLLDNTPKLSVRHILMVTPTRTIK